jgi:hypothetical protein
MVVVVLILEVVLQRTPFPQTAYKGSSHGE